MSLRDLSLLLMYFKILAASEGSWSITTSDEFLNLLSLHGYYYISSLISIHVQENSLCLCLRSWLLCCGRCSSSRGQKILELADEHRRVLCEVCRVF
jgi:hypothetical protein